MKRFHVGVVSALAALVVSAGAAAAPAAAQSAGTDRAGQAPPVLLLAVLMQGRPPCEQQSTTVPDAVNCGFETAVWGLNKAEWAALVGQGVVNRGFGTAGELATQALQAVDDAQKLVVGELCTRFEIDPEECPDI